MAFLVHLTHEKVPPAEVALTRGLIGFVVLIPITFRQYTLAFSKGSAWLWIRSVAGSMSILCLFWNLQEAGVGTGFAMSYLGPIFVLMIEKKVNHESATAREVIAIVLAVGAAFSLGLSRAEHIPALAVIGIGLMGSVAASIAYTSLRKAASTFSPNLIVSCLSITTVIMAPFVPSPHWSSIERWDIMPVVGVGITGLVGQLLLTRSYVFLPASIASTISLGALLVGLLLGVAFQTENPTGLQWSLYGAIFLGMILLYRGKR